LSALARMFRAQVAENEGDLDQVRLDVTAALDGFAGVGDRWGVATVLPMRALLRQYDGDLDGALADLRDARAKAREFGSLVLGDEIFIDIRWVDLYMRQGNRAQALAMMEAIRERAVRSGSPELEVLVNALEAGVLIRLGDVERARELVERAEAAMAGGVPYGGDHGTALVSSARAWLALELGDVPAAEAALTRAYEAGVASRDMPILSMVAVSAAGLAQLKGRHRDVALLLGAAARLRGTHDRTDPQIRDMLGRSREALGDEAVAEAYQTGWQLETQAASAQVDPARLRPELPVHHRDPA
jgi:ATP/maltotriose-dependent transcriptional regulator MalT